MHALDLVALGGVKPSSDVLDYLCRLVVDKIRPETGSRKAAWAAALWHLQPHIYNRLEMVIKATGVAPPTLRLYSAAWDEIDWDMVRELAQRNEAAQDLEEFREGASSSESSGADWPGPTGLDFSENRAEGGSSTTPGA